MALVLGLVSALLLILLPVFKNACVFVGTIAALLGAFVLVRAVPRRTGRRGVIRAVAGLLLGGGAALAYAPLMSAFLYYEVLPICASNLRGLGAALAEYARAEGSWPPDLSALIRNGYASPHGLHCPLGCVDHIEGEADYSYVSGLSSHDPPDWIVAFDPPTHHERGHGMVLYVSGEMKTFRREPFAEEIDRFRRAYEAARGQPPTILEPKLIPATRPGQ